MIFQNKVAKRICRNFFLFFFFCFFLFFFLGGVCRGAGEGEKRREAAKKALN